MMKYRYYLSAVQCNRLYCNFIKSCDLGIDSAGVPITISFVTDREPTKEIIEKIERLLNSSEQEESLSCYYKCVKFLRAEVVIEDKEENNE